MENQDVILASLEEYNKDPSDTIPTILEEYLLKIASTGETKYAWNKIKKLFVKKMDMVIDEFEKQIPMADLPQLPNVENVNFENMKRRLHNTVDRFDGIPFTIQRLCELLTNPKKHYKRTDKFMRGLEKNLLVVSTVDPFGNKIVNEKQVTTHHAYINGLDAANGMGNNRSDTTPLTPFLPPLNQSPSSTSPFAWFNTQITNLTESAGSVAPWNFTGTPMGSQAEEAKCGEGTVEGSRTSQDGDGNSSGSTGSSEGENMEESQELGSENVTSAHETDNDKDEEGNAASGRPDRDPNEEPPAKRFKEDDSPDSNEGGQGDIGEIKIQITTATPDKSAENEAEALQDKDTTKTPGTLSVSCSPEEVCDRRSSGGFEVTSSAGDEKTEPHRSDSGGFEVSSSAVSESKAELEVQSHKSDTNESKPLEEQLTEKEGTSSGADKMEEGSCSEAEASSVDMASNTPSDSDESKSDIDTDVNPDQRTKVADAESRTDSTETAEVQSTDAAVESCESGSKQEVTSSTNSELAESGTNVCESENKSVTTSENEAVCSTPVADDENSNQSDEMYFDASCATPEKKATQSQAATQVLTESQEVDSSEQPETNVESASNNEPTSSEGNDSPSEPMDTN